MGSFPKKHSILKYVNYGEKLGITPMKKLIIF